MLPFPIINNLRIKPENPGIRRLSSSNNSIVLQYNSGDTYALGTNSSGKYGTGDTTLLSAWTRLKDNVRLYCSGPNFSILVTNDNKVYGSGNIGYVFTGAGTSTTYVDITSRFSTFDLSTIKSIESAPDIGRLFLIDGTDKLWGIGSNQYNGLGSGSSTAGVSVWTALANGTNVKKVQCALAGTWIIKNDGTIWRTGTNTYRVLLGSNETTVFTTFQQYTSFNCIDISTSQYNTSFILTDGTLRICGNGGNGQLGNGSTGTSWQLLPYNPGLTACTLLPVSSDFYMSTVISSDGMYSTGSNGGGRFGINNGNTTVTTFTKALGSITSQNLGSISNICSVSNASYYVYDNKVYAAGYSSMILVNSSYVYVPMPTPYN